MEDRQANRKQARKRLLLTALLCVVCIGVNLLGKQSVTRLNLPLYLDCVGIILAAVLGGAIPGIVVGFFSNVINGLSDSITIYYCFTSVLIAIFATRYGKKGYFERFPHFLIPVLAFTLIGGGLGSLMTWELFGGGIGDGFSAPLARAICARGVAGEFLSQLAADLIFDLLDKAIEVLLAVLLLRLTPKALRAAFADGGDPESKQPAQRYGGARRVSLRVKILIIVAVCAVIVTAAVAGISLIQYRNSSLESEARMAESVAHTAASAFDHERVDEYLTLGRKAEGYGEVSAYLTAIADSSEDIAYVYVYRILPDGCHVVFDPDTADGPGSEPGTVIPFDNAFRAYLPALMAGEAIEPIVSNESYGWLLTVYLPVTNAAGECQCYVGVDILMSQLAANERVYLVKVLSLFLSFFVMMLAFGAWAADRSIITPINRMAAATGAFAYNSEEARGDSLARIQKLHISTGDEIENLYHAIQSTSEETVRYIADIQEKSEQITNLQNSLILVLADLVERRDKCTGNHVRNTATYVRLIMNQMRKMGMHTGELTDEYLDDVSSSAPLHDIGKIQISDTLLNKPGRLTDEEYARMQAHTTLGGGIIDRAIDMMHNQNSGYLNEAKNLTVYHHERWDGKGYPYGLKGDQIPLSARVMAVADVFDALVARRSYKQSMPFDKAVAIIRDGAGTHFDPDVVKAFLACLPEAERIAEEANRKNDEEY